MPIVVAGAVTPTPSTDSTSPDGLIRAQVVEDYAGVFLTIDFRSVLTDIGYTWCNPFKATVYRQDDEGNTVIVRAADERTRYGGMFHVFDDEVSFGRFYTYWVDGFQKDGSVGRRSVGATVLTWAPPTSIRGVWMKSLDDPSLSLPLRVKEWSKHTYASNTTKQQILNSSEMAINNRVRSNPVSTMTVYTQGEEGYKAFLAATNKGVVYIASLRHSWKRDGYYLVEGVESSRVTEKIHDDDDFWDMALTKISRPGTKGQNAPVFPWYNLGDRLRDFPTYADSTGSGRLYLDGVTP